MRKEYVISGFITLVWFIGLYVALWYVDYIVVYWSVLVLALFLFALGLLIPEKKGS